MMSNVIITTFWRVLCFTIKDMDRTSTRAYLVVFIVVFLFTCQQILAQGACGKKLIRDFIGDRLLQVVRIEKRGTATFELFGGNGESTFARFDLDPVSNLRFENFATRFTRTMLGRGVVETKQYALSLAERFHLGNLNGSLGDLLSKTIHRTNTDVGFHRTYSEMPKLEIKLGSVVFAEAESELVGSYSSEALKAKAIWEHLNSDMRNQIADLWFFQTILGKTDFHSDKWGVVGPTHVVAINLSHRSEIFDSGQPDLKWEQSGIVEPSTVGVLDNFEIVRGDISSGLRAVLANITFAQIRRLASDTTMKVSDEQIRGILERRDKLIERLPGPGSLTQREKHFGI